MEEFTHIYTASKKYQYEKEMDYDQNLLKTNLRKLLELLFVLFIRDHKFLTLVMNIKPIIFATTFNDVYDTLEEFLKRIIEMIYSPNIHFKSRAHMGSNSNQEIIKWNSSGSNEYIGNPPDSSEEKFYCYENYSFISGVIIELIKLNKFN